MSMRTLTFSSSGGECRNPTLGLIVRVQLTLPKMGDLESSGIPKNLEDNLRVQISSHWCFLYIIGKCLEV
jgi:hypothetical protein